MTIPESEHTQGASQPNVIDLRVNGKKIWSKWRLFN